MKAQQTAGRAKWRRGLVAVADEIPYPVEQEFSLALPLGYAPEPPAEPPRIAVLLHAFHVDLLPEFRGYLDHMPCPADLFVTTDDPAKEQAAATAFSGYAHGPVQTLIVPNRGRDVAPKLIGLGFAHDRYDYVLHLHTKRSTHDSRMAGWRGYLLETLLGSPDTVRGVLAAFARSRHLGMLAPQHVDDLRPWVRWNTNFAAAEALAGRMGFALPRRAPLDFPSGSMFWARSAALRPLLDLGLRFDDFPEESGQTDGTLAHAIERLYYLVCEQAGFDWMKITARGALHDQRCVTDADSPQALDRFLSRHRLRLSEMRGEKREVEDFPVFSTLPPRPRRALHVLWRRALGEGLPTGRARLAVVPLGGQRVEGIDAALRQLPPGIGGALATRSGQADAGSDSACRNRALRAGFATGADLVLLLDAPGLMHPGCAAALMGMSQAQGGRAVLEAARFPQAAPKPVDAGDFSTDWADGPALAVPRLVFEAVSGFDEALAEEDALRDFSRRVRARGFGVRHCPSALYLAAPTATVETTAIDVIVPLDDTSDLPLLERCAFALMGQGTLRLHVMLQRFSLAEVRETRAALRVLEPLRPSLSVALHNWQYPEPFELRVPLLNWGLEVARGRYVTCLDVADLPMPGAFARLLARLQATGAAVALGGAAVQTVRWWGDVVLPMPWQQEPGARYARPPLFLLDRARVAARDLAFREGQPGAEIAAFIERLDGRGMVDSHCRNELLGLRQVPGE